ncbi:hypothetical protein [Burkholderia ubonensis]|uniref:hypothetical protein n=1 Tax=Burkholderia ubonensis TaxID=101571 RepID=UPI000758E1C5|nr:hypothetical protein [Burkholderia ubonensis]KVP16844.1 hypothetical protein WJ84_00800 [Burkholderia ubonensis]KVP40030.1 hypothetical protein WJ87_07560 [Burkholderia ubonensis]
MKQREFKSVMASIAVKGKLSAQKAAALPSETRDQVMKHIVRNRQPIAICLLPDDIVQQDSWLNAMGYMYLSVSQKTGLTFRHTCEQTIQ